jgi:hypothetical protein
MPPSHPEDDAVPRWADAVAARLAFLSRRRRLHIPTPHPHTPLQPFLLACLDVWQQAVLSRPDLAVLRAEAEALGRLARAAVDGDLDDRPINARAADLIGLPGLAGFAARVPGRVAWLAAMAASLPDEEGAAAVMLVNDLAAIDFDLPLRAWRMAVQDP